MASKSRQLPLLLFLLFLLSITTSVLAHQREQNLHRDYEECQQNCQQKQLIRPEEQKQCHQKCEARKQGRPQRDPQQKLQECQQQYLQKQEQGQQQEQISQQQCVEQQEGANPIEQQQRDNPYLLDEQSFLERFNSRHGYARVSQRFSQISNLLCGVENYRLALFEADPNTFMIPHHVDAEVVIFIVKGKGTVTLAHQQNSGSYNVERGDVMRVPAGTLCYALNRDNNDKFQVASLFQPVSTPTGSFWEFFPAGGQNPESFINAFSDEIVEAAYNTERQSLDRLFSQQNKGQIIEASQEQIKALSEGASSSQKGSSRWTTNGSPSLGPYNLLSQTPEQSNEYGKIYTINGNQYSQLQDLNLEVAFYRINKGAMVAPSFNSRATSLVIVTDGRGSFEMACPHISSSQTQTRRTHEQEQEGSRGHVHYQRVSAHLSPQRAFIVPAGHPVSIVASNDQHLEMVVFKLNAESNQRNYLAGANNLLNQLEREAKDLSFNMPAREVDTILSNQRQSVFFPGPNQSQQQTQEDHGDGLFIKTVTDFVGF